MKTTKACVAQATRDYRKRQRKILLQHKRLLKLAEKKETSEWKKDIRWCEKSYKKKKKPKRRTAKQKPTRKKRTKRKSPPPSPPPPPSMDECTRLMCEYGLRTPKDFKRWSLKNHPDKGGDGGLYARVNSCYHEKKFC